MDSTQKVQQKNPTKNESFLVATFYKFTQISNLPEFKARLKSLLDKHQIKGTIILASEGLNSTICGKTKNIQAFIQELAKIEELQNLTYKFASSIDQCFKRTKVKIKKEIVTFGFSLHNKLSESNLQVGRYVSATLWNQLIEDENTILIDTRNDFEVQMGSFINSVNPDTKKFTEIKKFSEDLLKGIFEAGNTKPKQKIAMFCTGGIRCEKYSAYLLERCKEYGFEDIYHLEGGILKYLEEVPEEQSLWKGDCFVFDERRSVNHKTYNNQRTNKGQPKAN
jgi:UPF0176 protein